MSQETLSAHNSMLPQLAPHTANGPDEGYRRLAAFIATSPEHCIFRRFGTLNMVNVLRLQAELQDLEAEFEEAWQEDRDSDDPVRQRFSRSFRAMLDEVEEGDSTQYELLLSIGEKLKEYNQALQSISFLRQATRPTPAHVKFLKLWLLRDDGGKNFLRRTGIEGMVWNDLNKDDFILPQLSTGADVFTDPIHDRILDAYHFLFGRFRKSKVKDGVRWYSSKTIKRLEDGFIVAVSALLPTTAILALYFVRGMAWRFALVVLLTTLFSVAMAMFTGAKKSEIFAATATFAAIEVVYIGSTS